MQKPEKQGMQKVIQEILRGERKINKENMLVILLSGVLLFVIMLPTQNSSSFFIEEQEKETQVFSLSEQEEMENRLSAFLSQIDGVGNVKVLMHIVDESVASTYGYGSNSQNKIAGVIVAAEGAVNETIRLEIVKMVMALYDLKADEVEVYPLKRE